MECGSCGVWVSEGSRFCSQCGARLVKEPSGRRQLTVLFFDLVGYTNLVHSLDPEDVRDVTRRFETCGLQAIERHGGSIARYAGDGCLAYFGFPKAGEDDALRAVLAGLAIVEEVARIDAGDRLVLHSRVGIATGAEHRLRCGGR